MWQIRHESNKQDDLNEVYDIMMPLWKLVVKIYMQTAEIYEKQ